MTKLADFVTLVRKGTKQNSPVILSAAAGLGTIATAYLAGRASFQAAELIRLEESGEPHPDSSERFKERFRLVWHLYIPTAISAGATIVCIVGANRVEASKTLAAQTAFAVSERAYSEYRTKVIEQFGTDEAAIAKGKRKDQSIRDSIAEDRVKENPPPDILVSGPGNVLCCELFTGRYFASDMETLQRAVNKLNAKLLIHDIQTLDDFYWLIDVRPTGYSSEGGWEAPRLLELEFTSILTEDNRPCLAFNYNYIKPL
jgi:hypothetical protein